MLFPLHWSLHSHSCFFFPFLALCVLRPAPHFWLLLLMWSSVSHYWHHSNLIFRLEEIARRRCSLFPKSSHLVAVFESPQHIDIGEQKQNRLTIFKGKYTIHIHNVSLAIGCKLEFNPYKPQTRKSIIRIILIILLCMYHHNIFSADSMKIGHKLLKESL